jgi:hypothetical protein
MEEIRAGGEPLIHDPDGNPVTGNIASTAQEAAPPVFFKMPLVGNIRVYM